MAFEGLQDKLALTFKNLRGKGVLTEKDVDEVMREIRLALLEADVNFKVVKEFVETVREKALGQEVLKSLNPAQQVIKLVNQELITLMGGTNSKLTYSPTGFSVYMLVGLQGTGKTTTAGKLAYYLKKEGKNPMLAALDIYRPAAIEQLKLVGKAVDTPVFSMEDEKDPVKIGEKAITEARKKGLNAVILDTAGRLQIDEELMEELSRLKKACKPHEILLVVDALTGQDAVNAAEGFNERLGIDGIIMTKLDGDSRGGAALSTKKVTGRPIKFAGISEKPDGLEPFHPERMASRILGMGDMLSLIEKAEESYSEEAAKEMEKKMRKNEFTLEDFLDQMGQIRKMGGLAKIVDMLPGQRNKGQEIDTDEGEREFKAMEAVILSMTREEREKPSVLNASRRKRIAQGSGQPVSRVNTLIKRHDEMKKMMKRFSSGKMNKRYKGAGLPF